MQKSLKKKHADLALSRNLFLPGMLQELHILANSDKTRQKRFFGCFFCFKAGMVAAARSEPGLLGSHCFTVLYPSWSLSELDGFCVCLSFCHTLGKVLDSLLGVGG